MGWIVKLDDEFGIFDDIGNNNRFSHGIYR